MQKPRQHIRRGIHTHSFFSYRASEQTPTLQEAIALGAIAPNTTQADWDTLSAGFKREIVRDKRKQTLRMI